MAGATTDAECDCSDECAENLADATYEECFDCRYCFACDLFADGGCEEPVEKLCWGEGNYSACTPCGAQCEWFDYDSEYCPWARGSVPPLPPPFLL